MTTPTPTPHSSTRWWPAVVAAVGVLVVSGAAITLVVTRSGGDDATADVDAVGQAIDHGDAVVLEPVTYRSSAPFTESLIVTDEVPDDDAPADEFPNVVTGDTVRLYGSRSTKVCDRNRLINALDGDSELNGAWSGAVGVAPDQAGAFIESLTPVLLRTDTAVTNHIYNSDGARPYDSVLQSGTAVLVDEMGQPRVKCSCGNPLLAPEDQRPTETVGTVWDDYAPEAVVRIDPSPTPVPALHTVGLDDDSDVTVGVGGNVALDGTLLGNDDGVYVSTADGDVVQVLDEKVDRVTDDGAGGLVYTLDQPMSGDRSLPSNPAASAIWHLPAGSTEAIEIVPAAERSWNRLLSVGRLNDRFAILYVPLVEDPAPSEEDYYFGTGDARLRYPDTGEDIALEGVTLGWEIGPRAATIGGDRIGFAFAHGTDSYWMLFDGTGAPVRSKCSLDGDLGPVDIDEVGVCGDRFALDETGGAVVTFQLADIYALSQFDAITLARTSPSDGPTFPGRAKPTQVYRDRVVLDPISTGDSAFVVDLSSGSPVDMASPDGLAHTAWILTSPLLRPLAAGADGDAPATSGSDGSGGNEQEPLTYEDLAASFPIEACGFDAPGGRITFDDEGNGQIGERGDEIFAEVMLRPDAVTNADVDGDGEPDLIAAPLCTWGGSGYFTPLVLLERGTDGLPEVMAIFEEFRIGEETIDSLHPDDGAVEIRSSVWEDGDANCCASSTGTSRWQVRDGDWVRL